MAGTNVVIDATSERYVADFIQQSVRASTASSVNYSRPLGDGVSFGLTVAARTDADNVAGAKDLGAMVRFRLNF